MTTKQTLAAIRATGMSVRRTLEGEFRINFRNGSEDTAYYTEDAQDALDTAHAMASSDQFSI